MNLNNMSTDELIVVASNSLSETTLLEIFHLCLDRHEEQLQAEEESSKGFATGTFIMEQGMNRHRLKTLLNTVVSNTALPLSTFYDYDYASTLDERLQEHFTSRELEVYNSIKSNFEGTLKELLDLIALSIKHPN